MIRNPVTAESEEGGSAIEIGHHSTWEIAGFTVHADTITSTIIAGGVVIFLGLLLRRSASNEVPGKLQLAWEALVIWVNDQVESTLGRLNPFVVPLAASLFVFIFVANLLEVIPTDHKAPPPTADVNLTYALALIVIIGATVYGIRERGVKDYVKGFTEPYAIMTPFNILEEIAKPISLALRLFGNIFAGGVMLSIIAMLPFWLTPLPTVPWKLFGIFIGAIQALIFALLTILYFGMAAQGHGTGDHDDSPSADETDEDADEKSSAGAKTEKQLQPA
ncbi:F0F1 ATP synthase subunit A [Aeromicrobium sp.]|uniref:F0F1 ATP synthase subunit A n=1 Tax=Aeromicrobium sp. TaxID=1871063 RepID=UPI003D6A91B2